MCQVIPTSNQDGRQAKNRKKALKKRASGAPLPKVNLIDMRTETGGALSALLIAKMQQHLKNNKQVMLAKNVCRLGTILNK